MTEGEFLHWLHEKIPLTAAMGLQDLHFDGQQLSLSAPLAPNVNDKGTGFGGSLAALATLTGWCLTTRHAQRLGYEVQVVIAESRIRYLAPVTEAFTARVSLPDAQGCSEFAERLAMGRRARWSLQVEVLCAGDVAVILDGVYVASLTR